MTRRITKTKPITVRLNLRDEELFNQYLEREYLSASELLRQLVSDWLRQPDGQPSERPSLQG